MRHWSLWFGVEGQGFVVSGMWFGVWGLGFGVESLGFRVRVRGRGIKGSVFGVRNYQEGLVIVGHRALEQACGVEG